jgi:hypothetical protein
MSSIRDNEVEAGRLLLDPCESCDLSVVACIVFIPPLIIALGLALFRASNSCCCLIRLLAPDDPILRQVHLPMLVCFISFAILRVISEALLSSHWAEANCSLVHARKKSQKADNATSD